jgi:hypothetical protein
MDRVRHDRTQQGGQRRSIVRERDRESSLVLFQHQDGQLLVNSWAWR